ncbi:MAG TPA: glycosyltransferase family 4 protein [Chloroflexota bacterium]|nr:glycosyltransferase family 4 protein [Chloroflexota bacterium]
MRILMLNYEFPPLGAGGSTSSYHLARTLVELGNDVDVITMSLSGIPHQETMDGIRVMRVPSLRGRREVCHTHEMATYVLSGTLFAAAQVRRRSYDLVNSHFIFPTGPIAYMLRRLGGPRYVLTARGSDVPGHNPNRFRFDHQLLLPAWRHIVRDADAVVAVSHDLAARIHDRAGCDVTVIPNGCSPIALGGFSGEQLGLDPSLDGRRILMVTRLHEFKGVQYLIQAARRIGPNLEIHVVGDGPYRVTLENLAHELGVRVRFWGWLDRSSQELRGLYQHCSVFVFPSEREGSPAVLQEAMSAGLTVVAADAAGTPEVVGDAGILVPPRDADAIAGALERLFNSPTLIDELSERARRRVATEFNWTDLARRYERLYERVLGRPGGEPALSGQPT